ncbi:MAG TPA: PQQ-binding-like beta-propeller repeat protein, partial [Pyrinomonadaceae bacterium]|nr:PQQ-binding-like beta-propeller repeat protein [Pyrinomonadaceae bacterium]
MLKIIVLLVALLIVSPIVVAAGDEWSQFRGPNGTGVSETTGLPTEFGPNKNVIWKTELPAGHSSPVLTRDRIFVTAHDKEKLYVIALDRQTGKILWQREVPR